jgi:hypothetical protein
MGTTVEAPQRNYAQETRDNLQAQVDLAPQRYAADATYTPKYVGLNLSNLSHTLNGTADQPGLLKLYEDSLAPSLARQQRTAMEGNIADVEALGPRAAAAFRAANPAQSALLEKLNQQASDEWDAGGDLDPAMKRVYEQAIRTGQQARGLGTGEADAFMEALGVGQAAEQRRRTRQQFAQSMVSLDQGTSIDPFLALLGQSSQNAAQAQGVAGQGTGFSRMGASDLFNPESSYAERLYGQNANMQFQANEAGASNMSALMGGLLGLAGSGIKTFGGKW